MVNNIIFFKLMEEYKSGLGTDEALYMNTQALLYPKQDLSFLEEDYINNNAKKFYNDLADFSKNANSLLFNREFQVWDESTGSNEDLFYYKLERIVNNSSRTSHDDEVRPEFFTSAYFGDILKKHSEFEAYHTNWVALKEAKEKYGEDALPYRSLLEAWNKDENKVKVENEILDILKKEIKKTNEDRETVKSLLIKNTKTTVDGFEHDIVTTSFSPKNFYNSDSEWTSYSIGKEEINNLLELNKDRFNNSTDYKNSFEKIEFDFALLNIFRDWVNESFLKSRFWAYEDIIDIYPKKLMFLRNIKYLQRNVAAKADTKNSGATFSPLIFTPIISPVMFVKPAIQKKVNKEYLLRNANRKVTPKSKIKLAARVDFSKIDYSKLTVMPKLTIPGGGIIGNQIKCTISVFSNSKTPVTDASLKLYSQGKPVGNKVKVAYTSNVFRFQLPPVKGYSIQVVHPNYVTKKMNLTFSPAHHKSRQFKIDLHLIPKEILEVIPLESDQLLLVGCVGKTMVRDSAPIEGLKYH